jgi:hypothetical protein
MFDFLGSIFGSVWQAGGNIGSGLFGFLYNIFPFFG